MAFDSDRTGVPGLYSPWLCGSPGTGGKHGRVFAAVSGGIGIREGNPMAATNPTMATQKSVTLKLRFAISLSDFLSDL
jgi:hypothetical protein